MIGAFSDAPCLLILHVCVLSEMSAAIEAAPALLIETACPSFNQHWQDGAHLACSTAANSGINFFALQVCWLLEHSLTLL